MIGHIAERFVIHFFCAASLQIMVFFALKYWVRRNAKVGRWLSTRKTHLLVVSALIVTNLAVIREPFDVFVGGFVLKSYFDFLSWYLGSGTSTWGLYRFGKE